MSSARYSSELEPDPALRCWLLIAALLAMVTGLVVILWLPLDAILRTISGIVWVAAGCLQGALIASAHKQVRRIRLYADGEVILMAPDGAQRQARLANGSVVLRRIAWLRLQPARGFCHVELLCGCGRESQPWRRLQVIWRHLGRLA